MDHDAFLTFKVSRVPPLPSQLCGLWAELRVSPARPDLSPEPALTAGTPPSPGACLASLSCDTGSSWQRAPCPQLSPWCPPSVSIRSGSLPPRAALLVLISASVSACLTRRAPGGLGVGRLPGLRPGRLGGRPDRHSWGGRTGRWVARVTANVGSSESRIWLKWSTTPAGSAQARSGNFWVSRG